MALTEREQRRREYLLRYSDGLFTESGEVRLPILARTGLKMSAKRGGTASHQPTRARARAVMAAARPIADELGLTVSVRHTRFNTWAVLVRPSERKPDEHQPRTDVRQAATR